MRAAYNPMSDHDWTHYYLSQAANQSGAGFVGMPYQRGSGLGSFFRGVFRALMPIVKSAGKSIGKQALSTGADMASDNVAGNSIKRVVKRHGRKGAESLLRKAAAKLAEQQEGSGLGKVTKKKKKAAPRKKRRKKKQTKPRQDQFGLYYK